METDERTPQEILETNRRKGNKGTPQCDGTPTYGELNQSVYVSSRWATHNNVFHLTPECPKLATTDPDKKGPNILHNDKELCIWCYTESYDDY